MVSRINGVRKSRGKRYLKSTRKLLPFWGKFIIKQVSCPNYYASFESNYVTTAMKATTLKIRYPSHFFNCRKKYCIYKKGLGNPHPTSYPSHVMVCTRVAIYRLISYYCTRSKRLPRHLLCKLIITRQQHTRTVTDINSAVCLEHHRSNNVVWRRRSKYWRAWGHARN
jgi:hypothetical protein